MRCTILALVACALVSAPAVGQSPHKAPPSPLAGLQAAAEVDRDIYGIAHIQAGNDHDLYFMQGYVHAQDRLFQMDVSRRTASGTLAELLGPAALAGDVELRTIGIRRAAERSLAVISPDSRAALEAYADGVNAYVATAGALPPEYQALEITQVRAVDRARRRRRGEVAHVRAVVRPRGHRQHRGAADVHGGVRSARRASRSSAKTCGAPSRSIRPRRSRMRRCRRLSSHRTGKDGPRAETPQRRSSRRNMPSAYAICRSSRSTWSATSARARTSGRSPAAYAKSGLPLVANDPHLALDEPSTFYPIHLTAGDVDAMGSGFAGVPFVIVGQTRNIAWGATVSPLDVTDVFQEQVVPDASSPSGLSTIYKGSREAVIPIPETYRVNRVGDGVLDNLVTVPAGGSIPAATLIVPRRNNGPIVQLDLGNGRGHQHPVHRIQRHARARHVLDLESCTQPRRLQARAAMVRLGHAELRLCRHRRQHRLLRDLGSAGARGPAERRRRRVSAVVHPQRHGRQRVASGPASATRAGDPVRDPARERDAAPGQSRGRLVRQRQQRPRRHRARQQSAQPGSSRRGPLLPERRVRRGLRAGRITELLKGKVERRTGDRSRTCRRSRPTSSCPTRSSSCRSSCRRSRARRRRPTRCSPSLGSQPDVSEAVARFAAWKLTAPTGIPRRLRREGRERKARQAEEGRGRRERRRNDLQRLARPVHPQHDRRHARGHSRCRPESRCRSRAPSSR